MCEWKEDDGKTVKQGPGVGNRGIIDGRGKLSYLREVEVMPVGNRISLISAETGEVDQNKWKMHTIVCITYHLPIVFRSLLRFQANTAERLTLWRMRPRGIR